MKTRTILVVDDQKINRSILKKLLENEYNILEAENGAQALEVLRENKTTVSAVLLDIVMPVLDGYGVLAAMRDDAELSKIPVIVSSQKDGDEDEVHALSLGANDFIAKPYKADIIRHRLENTIKLRETAAIANRAEKDELTGLLNKSFFKEQASDILHQNPDKKYDLLCFDLERFKLVNDTYGTAVGDRLLCHVAKILTDRPETLLAARFSADHFYIFAERDDKNLTPFFRTLIEKLREFPVELILGAYCGVYNIENIDEDVIAMCDRAKLASDTNSERADILYSVYDDSLRQKLLDEQFITGAMKNAISEHQFKVYYQPKYDLHTEMVAGAEALVRWIHPERGFMSPGQFIPLFEKNGFISQLDRYVWEETVKDIRLWKDMGLPPVPVSVNVSRADIFNPRLPEILTGLLEKYGVSKSYLHLEITESAYTDNPQQIINVVGKLHDMGFVIEMDDFGSGYSSLNMLAELPVDILKLDMRFVQSESTNTSGKGIMSFVISLAKWMKLSVVAEGVETAEQISSLRSMDCNFVQGFYFAKPMPRPDFENILRTVAVKNISKVTETVKAQNTTTKSAADTGRVMLIVDDIEINRAVLSGLFEKNYTVVEKENGEQALRYLQENYRKVDVVLLDLLMPVMDGFQMLEKMKSDSRLTGIPVIVTSQGDVTAEERALDCGADDFISKPYSPLVVNHRVRNVVRMYSVRNEQRIALSETRSKEKTLMDSIPGGVATYRVKNDGTIGTEYVSEGLSKLCGYSTEEYLKYTKEDARKNIVPEDAIRLISTIRKSINTGMPIHELVHLYTRDKRTVYVHFDANIITDEKMSDEDAAIIYAVHTRVPVETESAIAEQNRYRYIMDNLDLAYFELDKDGSSYASDKFSLYCMSDESFENIVFDNGNYESVHPEDLPKLFEFFDRKAKKYPEISVTLRLKMKDGSYRWTQMMGFIEYDSNGTWQKTIGVLHDVDKEWLNQNRMLQDALDSAEKANRSKSDFLERVSHEMRTPLNGILGLYEVMRTKKAGDDLSGDLEQLGESSRYLLSLINDTIDVSSIENGRMVLHPTVCDGKTTINNVISMVMPSIRQKNIDFSVKADNLPYTKLYIDVGRVEQSVINILGNAVKFTPENGKIEFIMENLSQKDGVITDKITIRDNGIGMKKEFLGHIFEPFSQEHNDAKSIYRGTGLGMTIAKQCIELMGGSIEVQSEEGKGTTVSVILPLNVATRTQIEECSIDEKRVDFGLLRGRRILLCEDHPLNASIAIKLLEAKGIKVDHAENGRVGLDMFASSALSYYDAVLMDIRMPVMDGLEATRRIRLLRRKDAKFVPIVAMTANALVEDVKKAINAGMTEHLSKPVEPERLYSTLVKVIDEPNPFAGRKVLVVDDLEMNRALVKKAIEGTYTVLEAGTGDEALELLSKEKDVAALVTDIQMPQMDGRELIRRVRADRNYDNMAILANTIYGDHRQEEELLSLGANDFVYKPTSPQIILMRLEHILRNM